MISFGERCYSNQYDEISDEEFSDDEISGFANTTKFPTTKFLAKKKTIHDFQYTSQFTGRLRPMTDFSRILSGDRAISRRFHCPTVQ